MKRQLIVWALALLFLTAGGRQPSPMLAQEGECPLEGAVVQITGSTTVGEGYEGGGAPIFEPAYTVKIVEPSERAGETATICLPGR